MPTFLVTAKMNPALAARVEASVTGKRGRAAASTTRRFTAIARFLSVLVLGVAIVMGLTTYRRVRRDLEERRAALTSTVEREQASVTAKDRTTVERASAWITRLAGPWEGDVAAAGTLESMLARPALWVRGPVDALRRKEQIPMTSAVSAKDALLLCLVDPPPARTEAALLEKVRFANAGGAPLEARTANIRRLNDAIVGLPVLSPAFVRRVRSADDASEVAALEKELRAVPLERARRALRAEVLVVALDEKGDGEGPTELDGERPHDVRLAIVDLDADRVLFRTKKHVDPGWISVARRPTYAGALDSCALGYDLRHAPAN